MKYFNYQPNVPMGRVWGLFTELAELPEEELLGKSNYCTQYAHTLEIVNAAINGSFNSSEEFSLKAYEIKCNQTDLIEQKADTKHCLFIVDATSEDKDDLRVGYGDISETKLKVTDNIFDEVESLDAFESNLNELLNIRKDYIVLHGIDLVSVLIGSLKGIPETVGVLSGLLKNNSKLRGLVASLCEDSREGVLLNRLVAMV